MQFKKETHTTLSESSMRMLWSHHHTIAHPSTIILVTVVTVVTVVQW
jgi:hypothetical protein